MQMRILFYTENTTSSVWEEMVIFLFLQCLLNALTNFRTLKKNIPLSIIY